MSTTLALLVLASATVPSPDAWRGMASEDARISLVDIYAPWCGPCARLDREVFKGDIFRRRQGQYRVLKVDGDRDIGALWKARYHVVGYPTVLVLDAQGAELTRIFGFRPEAEFWAQVDVAQRGGHVGQQMLRLRRGELKGEELVSVLQAMIVRGEPEYEGFRRRLAPQLTTSQAHALDFSFARFELLRHRKDYGAALSRFDRLLEQAPTLVPRIRGPRLRALVGLGRHTEAMSALEQWAKDQPKAAGSIAWFCGKQNFAPKWAEGLVRAALKTKPKDAGMLDNLALLLTRQGRIGEAIEVLGEARRLEPEDAWLKIHERALRETGKPPF